MQTSGGQFGVPAEVPSHYNPVSNPMNNNNSNITSRTTSTTGSTNQALGHMLFNFSTPPDQHAPLSSPAPPPSHSQPASAPPVVLSKAGSRDGTAELLQESNPLRQQHQQQQQNPRFSHFLQPSAALPEHFQATDNAHQEQMVQQKQSNMGSTCGQVQAAQAGDPAVQPMQTQHELSLGLVDQAYSEGGGIAGNNVKGNAENKQIMSADPISLGDIDQAEEGAGAGSRWPRQETLALLKIRGDMDTMFRDTGVKRPLWEEVSRKMVELGYERSAKKCKEKFENVNKYYKRTKEGKVGRQDGKHYRFFTQLEALSANNNHNTNNLNTNPHSLGSLTPATMLISNSISSTIDTISKFKASASDSPLLLGASAVPAVRPSPRTSEPLPFPFSTSAPPSLHLPPPLCVANSSAATLQVSSPSSGEDEDDDVDDDDDDDDDGNDNDDYDDPSPRTDPPHDPSHPESKKRKRKASTSMMAFFKDLLKKVIEKQEQMHQKFLQALEKRETDRMIREEAWRRQEMARLSKEHELRAQERSSAAARDAALISFLQKFTGQTVDLPTASTSMPIAAQPVLFAPPLHQESTALQQYEEQDPSDPNSKRWLKPEVLALIDLHSSLQAKFTEAGPKGHLWEEIANGMAKLGYSSRNAKRCKEKWENINKYFKRAKESNKKRPENAKTCPYFHELDALYRKGSSNVNQVPYKPSIEHGQRQIDDDSVVHQPSSTSINTGQGTDGMDLDRPHNLQVQPPTISGAPSDQAMSLDTTAYITSSVGVVGAGVVNSRIVGDTGMKNVNNGGLQSKGSSMQLSVDAFHGASGVNASSTLDHNVSSGARIGFTVELGQNSQQQSASSDVYQHKQVNPSEFGKVNIGEEKESQMQSGLKESKPSVLAPLPNSASFMSIMLQKINSSGTAVNNITTNRDQ